MSVNVRWNGRGWPGKVPRSPVAPPEGDRQKELELKNGRPKGTVKSRMAKNGNDIKKKIVILLIGAETNPTMCNTIKIIGVSS
jgi:hypothetical protein